MKSPVLTPTTPSATPPAVDKPFTADERVPAKWAVRVEGDGIYAFNNMTRRVFVGAIKEFNARLKG